MTIVFSVSSFFWHTGLTTVFQKFFQENLNTSISQNRISLFPECHAQDIPQNSNCVKFLAAKSDFSCAILVTGKVKCWGQNDMGQLGNGTMTNSNVPVEVSGLTDVKAIALGFKHACALLNDGTLRCWGKNDVGQLGIGLFSNYSPTPLPVLSIFSDLKAITANGSSTCATRMNGSLVCWGRNHGHFGNGASFVNVNQPVATNFNNVTQVAMGVSHTCALFRDGRVRCAGNGQFLGRGIFTDSYQPVNVTGVSTATSIVGGAYHTCVILTGGSIRCWGSNVYGQTGNPPSQTLAPVPVVVPGITGAVKLSAGNYHGCAGFADNSYKCWGWNSFGELGTNSTQIISLPVTVTVAGDNASTPIMQMANGGNHSCALTQNSVLCWGKNDLGQVGDTTNVNQLLAKNVYNCPLAKIVAIGAAKGFTCGVLSSGKIKCWGRNEYGQLGKGFSGGNDNGTANLEVINISNAEQVTGGEHHACALLTDGTVKCWGRNDVGQLGTGTTVNSLTPVPVIGISNAQKILSNPENHSLTCALLTTGQVKCWGGWPGSSVPTYVTPVLIQNLTNALDFDFHATATATPLVVALQNGLVQIFSAPNLVPTNTAYTNVIGVAGGGHPGCRLQSSGQVSCSGYNPMPFIGNIVNAVAITSGHMNVCALESTGEVKCFWTSGYPSPPSVASYTATTIAGISNATAISASWYHQCALLATGEVKCWGQNNYGQLGNFTTTTTWTMLTPVTVLGY